MQRTLVVLSMHIYVGSTLKLQYSGPYITHESRLTLILGGDGGGGGRGGGGGGGGNSLQKFNDKLIFQSL